MGATRAEVQEVIIQVSAYAGMPVTLAALDAMRSWVSGCSTANRR